jgi:hypothetical protein
MNNNLKSTGVANFLVRCGISNINAVSVAHVTTNLQKAMIYQTLRKRHFTHRNAMGVINGLTARQQSELETIIMKSNKSSVRNAYFNARKMGATHNKAMNSALFKALEIY